MNNRSLLSITAAVLVLGSITASAQPPAAASQRPRRLSTTVRFELLAPRIGSGVVAQRWGKALAEHGVSVRVRPPLLDDKAEIKENVRGTLREVVVIGTLDREGNMVLPERTFKLGEGEALREFIDELRVYGAQGAPDNKPLWGLSRLQFQETYNAMSVPITADVRDLPLREALVQLPINDSVPLRILSSAQSRLASSEPVETNVSGFALGTGLAAVLRDYGLGFRPSRTPDGGLELAVRPLDEIPDPWPVGWDLPEGRTRLDVAPQLFKMVPVEFEEVPLSDVLNAVTAAAKIPILVDRHALAKKDVSLNETLVSYPKKRTAWSLLINSVIRKAGLTKELKIDELGRAFLDVYPFVPQTPDE